MRFCFRAQNFRATVRLRDDGWSDSKFRHRVEEMLRSSSRNNYSLHCLLMVKQKRFYENKYFTQGIQRRMVLVVFFFFEFFKSFFFCFAVSICDLVHDVDDIHDIC